MLFALTNMVQERIDKRPGPMTRRGMDHQAGRLVQNQEAGVFIQNVEGNILGLNLKGLRTRNHHDDRFTGSYFMARFNEVTIDGDMSLFNQTLEDSAGKVGLAVREKLI